MKPPIVFCRSVNPISIKGADYAHQIILAPPDFQTFRRPCLVKRCVVSGWAGWALCSPLGIGSLRQPYSNRGGGILCPPNITACPSRFENITTPLQMRDNYAAEKYAPYAFLLELKKFSGGFTYLF